MAQFSCLEEPPEVILKLLLARRPDFAPGADSGWFVQGSVRLSGRASRSNFGMVLCPLVGF